MILYHGSFLEIAKPDLVLFPYLHNKIKIIFSNFSFDIWIT